MKAIFLLVFPVLAGIASGCSGYTKIGELAEPAGSGGKTAASGGLAMGGSGTTAGGNSSGGRVTLAGGSATGGSRTTGGLAATGGSADAGGEGSSSPGLPCEVLEEAGHPCVAAHSTVRVLVPGYTGSLYRVQRDDGAIKDIGSVDGYADAPEQTEFCGDGSCVIAIVYDQSPGGNDLSAAAPGRAKPTPGAPVNADALPVRIDGHSAFGMLFRPGQGYRKVGGNGTAVGDEPQNIYMVSSQHDLTNGCCFDYGNAQTLASTEGNGTAEAVYVGMGVIWGTGVGQGPWVMGDLENGLYAGWESGQDANISTNTPVAYDFVTAVLVGDTADKNEGRGRFALFGGDATTGLLGTKYDGRRPEKPGYVPMQKEGSVILGVAGDNSNSGGGRFYEGVMANGAATKRTLNALQAAVVAARYGK
jgi:non-reducing end alpha-L-arabinofuranosidase